MSLLVQGTPSPRQRPLVEIDETKLPKGHCRFLIADPESKSHRRCSCVAFTRNRFVPHVTCECGHATCYHIREAVEQSDQDGQIEHLRRRLKTVEEGHARRIKQIEQEAWTLRQLQQTLLGGEAADALVRRVGNLEEQGDKSSEDLKVETRAIYQRMSPLYQFMEQLKQKQEQTDTRLLSFDDRLEESDETVQTLDGRLKQCDDTVIDLVERFDQLEEANAVSDRPRRLSQSSSSNSDSPRITRVSNNLQKLLGGISKEDGEAAGPTSFPRSSIAAFPTPSSRSGTDPITSPWTVHVSLLPKNSQMFPFEKDSTAYKRLLSRGLHKMVVVTGTDKESFVRTITEAFGHVLRGAAWVPLQARLLDIDRFRGLPRVRRLDPALGTNYDAEFIRKHCAICGPSGKPDSMYIALELGFLMWAFLGTLPSFTAGLEDCWKYDDILDADGVNYDISNSSSERKKAFDDTSSCGRPSLKRAASELGSTPPGSGHHRCGSDDEGRRHKMPRMACIQVPAMDQFLGGGIETV